MSIQNYEQSLFGRCNRFIKLEKSFVSTKKNTREKNPIQLQNWNRCINVKTNSTWSTKKLTNNEHICSWKFTELRILSICCLYNCTFTWMQCKKINVKLPHNVYIIRYMSMVFPLVIGSLQALGRGLTLAHSSVIWIVHWIHTNFRRTKRTHEQFLWRWVIT